MGQFSELLGDEATRKEIGITFAVTLVMFAFVMGDLILVQADIVQDARNYEDWQVSFDEESVIYSQSETLQDGETREFTFQITDEDLSEGYRMGLFRVTVSYSETSGVLFDTEDTVSALMHEHGIEAQWNHDDNIKSDTSNDGSDLILFLMVYPDYDGQSHNVSSPNEYQALQEWTEDGWGLGEFTIEIELETTSSAFGNDSDEDITVEVEAVSFMAIAEVQ